MYQTRNLTPGGKHVLSVNMPYLHVIPRSFRPLPGQPVELVLTGWALTSSEAPTKRPAAAQRFTAVHHMEPGDTYSWLAASFGFTNATALARANNVAHLDELGGIISLPGWTYVHATGKETLTDIDRRYRVAAGSARLIGRILRPDQQRPCPGEMVAIPDTFTGRLPDKVVTPLRRQD